MRGIWSLSSTLAAAPSSSHMAQVTSHSRSANAHPGEAEQVLQAEEV